MEAYYTGQSSLPHFSSYQRQRGSGIGTLAAGLAGVAIPFSKKYLLPAAKRIGRDFLMETLPEIADVVTKRRTPKQALKRSVRRTIKRQLGQGQKKKRKKQIIRKKLFKKRSRSNFFKKVGK